MTGGEITFVVQKCRGGYHARARGHSIFTESSNLPELRRMLRDAVECHFEPADMPTAIRLSGVCDEVIRP